MIIHELKIFYDGGVEDFSSGLGRIDNFNGTNEITTGKCN